MGDFRKFRVWREAIDLTKDIYFLTSMAPFKNDYGLKDQIQRASVSIASNIAEGGDRVSSSQSVYFFNIAKGSSAEVITLLIIASEIKYIDQSKLDYIVKIKY
jgi:four helix bundle protein